MEATSIIESDVPLDLVFTDLTLQEDHNAGIAIGKLVEEKRPGVPALYTSGRELTDGLRSLFVENSDFLGKPYTGPQIVKTIAALMRKM